MIIKNGKENGNLYNGFQAFSTPFSISSCSPLRSFKVLTDDDDYYSFGRIYEI